MLEVIAEFLLDLVFLRWLWSEDDDIPWWTILMVLLLLIGIVLLVTRLCGVW